jgi:hypothetical protein
MTIVSLEGTITSAVLKPKGRAWFPNEDFGRVKRTVVSFDSFRVSFKGLSTAFWLRYIAKWLEKIPPIVFYDFQNPRLGGTNIPVFEALFQGCVSKIFVWVHEAHAR